MATIEELGALPPPVTPQVPQGGNTKQMLLSLLPIIAALKSGGAAGAGGFAQGWTQSRTYLDEQKKRDALLAQQQEERQAEIARREAADQERKRGEAFKLLMGLGPHIGDSVLGQMDQNPDLDPAVAGSQEAQKYADLIGRLLPGTGIQAGDIQAMLPDVKSANSVRVTKHAQEVLANLKGYSTKDLRAMGAKIPFMGRAVTYDELLQKAGQPEGLTPTSEQPKPQESPKVGTFEDYVQRTYGANPTPEQILEARKKYQQADDRPTVNVMAGGSGSPVEDIAQAIVDGLQPPETTGLYRYGAGVRAALAKKGYNMVAAQRDWRAVQRYMSTIEGPQQVRMRQAVDNAYHSLDVIEDLANQWKGGRFPALNRARVAAAKQGALGPDAQKIATALDAQIADVTSELANVYMGGNSPTDHAMDLARKNLAADWSQGQLLTLINQARTNLKIRQNSIANAGPIGISENSPYVPTTPSGGVEEWVRDPATGKLVKKGGL